MENSPAEKVEAADAGRTNPAFVPDICDLNSGEVSTEPSEVAIKNSFHLNKNLQDPECFRNSNTPLALRLQNGSITMNRPKSKTPAVEVRNAYKSYKWKGTNVILNDFNMTVEEGSIYSLLGSSGCGKTTLLSCCVGVKDLDRGQIKIFGHKPGTRKAGVPGRNVGYMPQDIAIYPELTIKEVLLYYGRMFGMSSTAVADSTEFLITFLALPPSHRRVGSLSGGQMRRLSFSIALVHSPKLLILDEPTVGVDPLLRASIWNHLVKLTASGDTTVIITTHYIEESRQSNRIGLMRGGRLLTEDSPENLLRIHNTHLLEDIVLKLCLQDKDTESLESNSTASSVEDVPSFVILSTDSKQKQSSGSIFSRNKSNKKSSLNETEKGGIPSSEDVSNIQLKGFVRQGQGDSVLEPTPTEFAMGELRRSVDFTGLGSRKKSSVDLEAFHQRNLSIRRQSSILAEKEGASSRFLESWERIAAMFWKNMVTLLRNIPFLLFMFFTPAVQVIIVCMAIGADPKGVSFGLVNFDHLSNTSDCPVVPGCVVHDGYNGSLSCKFLDILGKHGTLKLTMYDNEDDAAKDVLLSKTWGYLLFHENYTVSMKERAIFGTQSETDSIYGSRIKFRLDQSNLQIYRETTKVFLESFKMYMKTVSEDCDMDPIVVEPPIYFAEPIFGQDSVNFTDFLAPSILLAILFFFPLSGSGIAYITEKKMGTLARSLVAGASAFEIMMAYLFVQLILLCIQVGLSFLILDIAFHIKILGPIHCAYILSVLVGVAGMSMGFVIALIFNSELEAVLVALGTFLPNMLLSGLMWPIEGMPVYLQHFSKILPCTYAGEAMRSILTRGVSYTHPSVWPGFVSILIWIVFFWSLNIIIHKFKSKS